MVKRRPLICTCSRLASPAFSATPGPMDLTLAAFPRQDDRVNEVSHLSPRLDLFEFPTLCGVHPEARVLYLHNSTTRARPCAATGDLQYFLVTGETDWRRYMELFVVER
jgi:hypothetical protein